MQSFTSGEILTLICYYCILLKIFKLNMKTNLNKQYFYILTILILLWSDLSFCQSKIYIPYRKGNLWGFADTLGNVIIKPIGKSSGTRVDNLFLFNNEDSSFVVDLKNKILISESNRTIYIYKNYIRLRKKMGSGDWLYSKDGKLLSPKDVVIIKSFLEGGDFFCLFYPDGQQAIVEVTNNKANPIKWHIKASNIEIEDQYLQDQIVFNKEGVYYSFVPGKQMTVYKNNNNKPEFEALTESSSDNNNNIKKNIYNPHAVRYLPIQKFNVSDGYKIIIKKEFSYRLRVDSVKIDTMPTIFKNVQIISQSGNRNFFENRSDNAVIEDIAFVCTHEGKNGIIGGDGNTLLSIEFDEIDTNYYFIADCNEIGVKVKKNNLYGFASSGNPNLIPIQYERIILKHSGGRSNSGCLNLDSGVIVSKNGKYGLISPNGIIIPMQYDEMSYTNNPLPILSIKKNGRYGLVFDNLKIFDPVFSELVSNVNTIEGYEVGVVKDKRFKLIGYVDKKGFSYYED